MLFSAIIAVNSGYYLALRDRKEYGILSNRRKLPLMTLSDKKIAATKFREEIRRSNDLHTEYLDDPQLLESYDRFATWQLQYLLPFFSDLYAQQGYAAAIDFTMSDLAGVGVSRRDHDLERVAPIITRMLPTHALETLASAAEMNARVLKVNIGICRCLLVDSALPDVITERAYFVACRQASSLEECAELVHLVTGLGHTLKSLIEVPMIGMLLRTMRAPAHAAGFGALQEFLETGYWTFREIPDIDHFLGEIEGRMISVFERIYTLPMHEL